MDRNEFVSTLRAVLTGEVPASVVEENVHYYDSYISQEIASGKSEQEVLDSLGDPRLIARTILDTQGGQRGYQEQRYEEQAYYDPQEEAERRKGFHAEINEEGGVDIKYKKFNFNTWYGKLLVAVTVILLLVLVIAVVGGILAWVLPVVIPVLLILWLIRLFFGNRW